MDGRANHGWIGARGGRARRAAGWVVPWGLSLLIHAGIAAAAAVVAITVVPRGTAAWTAAGSIMAPQPTERIATGPRAYDATLAGASNTTVPGAPAYAPGQSTDAAGQSTEDGGGLSTNGPRQGARTVEGIRAGPMSAGPARAGLASAVRVDQGADSSCGAAGVFGLPLQALPRSSLLGAGGNAAHVVYVIDRSGSMIGVFEEVRRSVLLSIGRLSEDQDFHVILFAQGQAIESPPRCLVPPTEANKLQAAEFLAAARAGSQSDPVPALRRAFDVLEAAPSGGKLIYLLSDGVFPDGPVVLATIHTRNKDKDVHINTYGCGGGNASATAMLQEIARATGGLFRQVGPEAAGP